MVILWNITMANSENQQCLDKVKRNWEDIASKENMMNKEPELEKVVTV